MKMITMHKRLNTFLLTLFVSSFAFAQTANAQSTPTGATSKVISSSGINVYWASNGSNVSGFRIERKTGSSAYTQIADVPANVYGYEDRNLSPLTRYTYRIFAYNQSSISGYSNETVNTTWDGPADTGAGNSPSAVPTDSVDEAFDVGEIGNGNLESKASYDSEKDIFRLSASGGRVWGLQDDFNFVHREISGDIEVTVKVSSLTAADDLAKAGIMFRQSPQQDAIHATLSVSAGKGVALARRHDVGGGTTRSGKGNISAPVWLRLVKKGTLVSSYYSEDQDNWNLLAEDFINFSDTIFVGLVVAANEEGQTVEADFEGLSIVDLSSAPASQTYISADIGKVGVNGDVGFDSQMSSFVVEASGGDIGHTQDAFHYVYREITGDFEGVVKLDSLVAEEDWAKAGLMIRGDVQPDAQYVAMMAAKNVGVVYQSRSVAGGQSAWSMKEGIVDPVWMKLNRAGNQFRAFYSSNGTDWTLQDEVSMDLPDTALFGMAVTSHQEGSLAFAEFTNLAESVVISSGGGSSSDGGTVNNPVPSTPTTTPTPTPTTPTTPTGSSNPVASFTRTPGAGVGPLQVNVDASSSYDSDGTIARYEWNWNDGSSNGNGVRANHTFQRNGTFEIQLTVWDNAGLSHTTSRTVQVTAEEPLLPDTGITAREIGYNHVELAWNDNVSWEKPWLIQRSNVASFIEPTDLTDNQAEDNTGSGSFRWLGVNANNYVDIDGIEEGTTYYWRVAPVNNLSAHYQTGAKPTYGNWIYGSATTKTLAASKKVTYDVTKYGAVANDGQNDYPATLAAFKAAEAAGGGIIYFPSGTYDIWPTDSAVTLEGGIPTLRQGNSAVSTLFRINSDNITFLGDANGAPTTFWKLYLWHKKPATSWLQMKDGSGNVTNVRRYFVFKPNDVAQTTIRNIDIDMGAPPVNTGKEWYSLDQKRYEWDISHKLWAAHDTTRGKNTIFDNVRARNCRGEIIYVGGSSEKMLIKNCVLERSNSSSVSGSVDLEIVNTVIRDSANAAVESAIHSTDRGLDGQVYAQNHIARGCTFIGLDQSGRGMMKDLPGKKTFSGWHVFNEKGTYQSVTDTKFVDCVYTSFGPWYEYRNGLRFNCEFDDVPDGYSGSTIYTNTTGQKDYLLEGGMSDILWVGDTINVNKTWGGGTYFFTSYPGRAAAGNESPWIWDNVHFKANGGNHTINRLWVDTWSESSGRQDVVFSNWTMGDGISLSDGYLQFLRSGMIEPTYVNFLD